MSTIRVDMYLCNNYLNLNLIRKVILSVDLKHYVFFFINTYRASIKKNYFVSSYT